MLRAKAILVLSIAIVLGSDQTFAQSHPVAPTLAFNDLSGGEIMLDQFRGSVVLLNFWTTSCGVCLSEIPTLSSLQDRYGTQGLNVLGVALDANTESLRKVAEQRRITYKVVAGDNRMEEALGADGFPVTFLIGRDGRIYSQHSGATSRQDLESEVTQLLAADPNVSIAEFRASTSAEPVRLPTAAELQSEIPGVDLSALSQPQVAAVKQQLDSEACPCGCNRSVLKCRSNHSSCNQSKDLARQAVERLRRPMI